MNYTYGRGYFEQYKENQSFSDYDLNDLIIGDTIINETDLIRRRWLDNRFYVVTTSISHTKKDLAMSFGSSFSLYDGDHFGEIIWAQYASDSKINDKYYEGNGEKLELNIFTKATYKLN